jgi:hypothetical protein
MFYKVGVDGINSLTAIRVPAGTKNITGRTFQVGTYHWRELTHEEYPPQPLPHMRRNCYRPLDGRVGRWKSGNRERLCHVISDVFF